MATGEISHIYDETDAPVRTCVGCLKPYADGTTWCHRCGKMSAFLAIDDKVLQNIANGKLSVDDLPGQRAYAMHRLTPDESALALAGGAVLGDFGGDASGGGVPSSSSGLAYNPNPSDPAYQLAAMPPTQRSIDAVIGIEPVPRSACSTIREPWRKAAIESRMRDSGPLLIDMWQKFNRKNDVGATVKRMTTPEYPHKWHSPSAISAFQKWLTDVKRWINNPNKRRPFCRMYDSGAWTPIYGDNAHTNMKTSEEEFLPGDRPLPPFPAAFRFVLRRAILCKHYGRDETKQSELSLTKEWCAWCFLIAEMLHIMAEDPSRRSWDAFTDPPVHLAHRVDLPLANSIYRELINLGDPRTYQWAFPANYAPAGWVDDTAGLPLDDPKELRIDVFPLPPPLSYSPVRWATLSAELD